MEKIENEKSKPIYVFKNVSLMDKFNFYEYLSVMVDGWVTLPQALASVSEKIKNEYFKEKVEELTIYISSWDQLSKSMKKLPDVFSQSETSVVEAWESSGTLVLSLATMATEFKKLHELRSTVKQALTYPIIIMVFLFIAVMVVMTYVIPALIPLIDNAWVDRPAATQALISTSNFVSNNFLSIVVFLFLLIWLFFVYKNSDWWKRFLSGLYLKLPLIWPVYKNYIIATSSSMLWILMNAWIPVVKTVILVWKSTNNHIYESLFNDVASKISVWKRIVDSMVEVDKEWEFFPWDFIQLLSVWEKTASLDKVCKKLNEQYIREVNYSLANLTKWIEPMAILIAWVFVLWFAFAIFWAILKLTETVG